MKCPVCETDEFVKSVNGSHVEMPNGSQHNADYKCSKCDGVFYVDTIYKNGEVESMKIKYEKDKHDSCSTTWA